MEACVDVFRCVPCANSSFVDIQPVQGYVILIPSTELLNAFPIVTFKHYNIGVKFVNGDDPKDFAAAIDEKTKAIFVESIGNPKYNVAPIPELAKVRLAIANEAHQPCHA